jgi:hypothetical protein
MDMQFILMQVGEGIVRAYEGMEGFCEPTHADDEAVVMNGASGFVGR